MGKNAAAFLVGILLLVIMGGGALAAQAEWRDSAYDFGRSSFVLVMTPQFSYDGYDVSGRNKFNRYPYATEKITDMINSRIQGSSQHKYVNMEYVWSQIKSDPTLKETFDPLSPGFAALVQREMGKHVDLILFLDVRDFGWFYEYHDAYVTTETTTERVYYNRKNSDGTETSGWRDVPKTNIVHHKAGYYISDCAEAAFRLYDARSGKDVWKYSDSRTRKSPALSNGYDPSGPESMMKRIFDDAFKKNPLVQNK